MNAIPKDNRSVVARILSESSAIAELAANLTYGRLLPNIVARGDGHSVMLIPGFTAADGSMSPLRKYLQRLDYQAEPWGQGRNLGVSPDTVEALLQRLDVLCQESGNKVSLIGWSGGGFYARALANLAPANVRQVITLGSPFKLSRDTLDYLPGGIHKLHQRINGDEQQAEPDMDESIWHGSPDLPSTSLFSKRDALAPWPFCLDIRDHQSENIRVPGSHAGMTVNPLIHYIVADRLAQPEGEWQPFKTAGVNRVFRHACGSRFHQ